MQEESEVDMDRKKEKKVKTKVLRIRQKGSIRWELTEQDVVFLRSCNIDPA